LPDPEVFETVVQDHHVKRTGRKRQNARIATDEVGRLATVFVEIAADRQGSAFPSR